MGCDGGGVCASFTGCVSLRFSFGFFSKATGLLSIEEGEIALSDFKLTSCERSTLGVFATLEVISFSDRVGKVDGESDF